MNTVVTVLRSGGEFNASHVQAMQRQVERWAPAGTMFKCLSDIDIPGVECIPLRHSWPGWWSKLELFRPDLKGDFLFTDLDNAILGPIYEFFGRGETTLQQGGWTALMWLTEEVRAQVWDEFIVDPEQYMERFAKENRPKLNGIGNYGDAGFISWRLGNYRTWDEDLPGQTVNLATLKQRTYLGSFWFKKPEPDARVVLCGQPYRPWTLPMFRNLGLYGEAV